MRALLQIGLGLGLGLGLVACEDTAPFHPGDGPGMQDMSNGPDLASTDLAAAIEFEDFVLGLINTQTADTTKPTLTEDKIFKDSMDPTKFNSLFP